MPYHHQWRVHVRGRRLCAVHTDAAHRGSHLPGLEIPTPAATRCRLSLLQNTTPGRDRSDRLCGPFYLIPRAYCLRPDSGPDCDVCLVLQEVRPEWVRV